MLSEHIDLIESLGLKLFFVAIFLLIGLAIQDVLKRGNVPRFGRFIVWLVLNRLISRILIGEVKKVDGQKVQEVRIVYNFVGEIPEIAT
jgi:hypothetical protein